MTTFFDALFRGRSQAVCLYGGGASSFNGWLWIYRIANMESAARKNAGMRGAQKIPPSAVFGLKSVWHPLGS